MSHPGPRAVHQPVAIVGIGCRFPGGVTDPDSFWRLLENGSDAIGDIPADRMDIGRYFGPEPATPGRMITRWGGFLDGIDMFDAEFFGISPREAERLDPQQRLLLETAWEALEDAGQDLRSVDASRSGVFVGQWISDFESRLFTDPAAVDFQMTTGSGRYAASGRLSYALGFRGASLTVDTACSSSLAAVHLAVRSIRSGEIRLALAGGVNVILQPHINIAYSQSRMMAADGRCKFGDACGDGYVRSEGVALVVLKALPDAVADGDRIYAIIRGSALNNDGRSSGSMGTPSRTGQEELLRAAYDDAGLSAARVGYVEAHGTGTRVGDPVELAALAAVLGEGRRSVAPVFVGSVKTNIGHTEGAAGAAGLIKAALALHRGAIPPSLHCREPNPTIPWAEIPCTIPGSLVPWRDGEQKRVAGVSAFGIAGTNGHVVLEAVDPAQAPEGGQARALQLLPLSAKSPAALRALADRYAALLSGSSAPALHDLCWSAAVRRTALDHRAVFVADDSASMAETLRNYSVSEAPSAEGVVHAEERPKMAFVLPGQGAQWFGMGRQLLAQEPVFRAALECCDQAARPFIDWSIIAQLGAEPGSEAFRLDQIDVIQPVLVALAIAYAALLRSFGIVPDAVVGHSMGEVAAACIAGALDLDQAMRVICRRSALLRRVSGQGAMALVDLAIDAVRPRLAGIGDRVAVAASNAPRSSVISGQPEAVRQVMAGLERDAVFTRLIKVDVASHSPQMNPLAPELAAALAGMRAGAAQVAMYSTVFGRRADGEELGADYWARNLREPVLFSTSVRQMVEDGITVFLELGPHPILAPSVQQIAPAAATIALSRSEQPEQAAMLAALGALWMAGYPVDWRGVMPEGSAAVRLPLYPWQREHFWVDAAVMRPAGSAGEAPSQPDAEQRGWLYRLDWKMAETRETDIIPATRRWLVLADDVARGSALAEALTCSGADAKVASVGRVEAALAEAARTGRAPGGIVTLAGDDTDTAYLPLRVLQACLATVTQQRPRLWFVTQGAQAVTTERSERVSVEQAALWGAARVVAEEHPDLWGGLVDLDPTAPQAANARLLSHALLSRDGEDQVAFRQDGRHVLRLVAADLGPFAAGPVWRRDGSYLITGGFGGVGQHVARALVAAGARRLILMARTALPPRAEWSAALPESQVGQRIAVVRALEQMGVAVHTPAVDVSDAHALRAFLDTYAAEGWPPIRGVLHTAVALNNRLAGSMDRASFDAVMEAKLRAAQSLDRLLPHLDCFVLFSSIGAFLPHPGVANYAAANAGLDALAQDRRARGQPALSIAWGPWNNAGLALGSAGEHAVSEMARQGIQAVPTDAGATLFAWLCRQPAPAYAVMPTDWGRFRQARSGRPSPLLRDLLADLSVTADAPLELLDQLATATSAQRRQILESVTRSAVAHVLKVAPARLDPRKTLGNMGLSSLLAIELRNRLEMTLQRPLSATLAWNYPTIDAIVGYLLDEPAHAASVTETTVPVSSGGVLTDVLAEIAALPEEAAMLVLRQPAE
jgi:phthiocerol/phenolphthiocerol synthesis type-I polyketide synthase B